MLSLTLAGPADSLDLAIDQLLDSGHDVFVDSATTVIAHGDCPQIAGEAVRDLDWSVMTCVEREMLVPKALPEAA